MDPDAGKRDRRKLDLKTIRRLYLDEGLTQRQIAERFGVSKWTIQARLKRLKVLPPPPKRIDPKIITNLYVKKKWSAVRIAKHLDVTDSGVRHRLKSLGLLRPRAPRDKPDIKTIKQLYVEKRWSRRRIAIHFGVSDWLVDDRLMRAGVTLRPRSFLDDETTKKAVIERIKDLYLKEGLTVAETARRVHTDRPTVTRLLKSSGIQVPRRPDRDVNEILRLYGEEGWPADRIAERFGTTTRVIYHHVFNAGLTRRSLRPRLDPKKIRKLYVDQEMSGTKIAEMFQVGYKTLAKFLDAEGIERRPRGKEKRKPARYFDPRLARLEVGECFHIQVLDPQPAQVYFSKQARKLNIRIATRKVGPTTLRITRYE